MAFALKPRQAITAAVVLLILCLAVYASTFLSQQTVVVNLVAEWGYIGVLFLGFISGVNAVLPIPAATLTPVFTAAGLVTPGIVTALVVGTMLADFVGYLFGSSTKGLVAARYPHITKTLHTLTTERRRWVLPFVAFYAAFVPFPNEAMLIPLAFSGIGFGRLLVPLLVGNTIHQLLLVVGATELSRLIL